MNKIIPDCFKHIAIIAPAGPAEQEKVMAGVKWLRSCGKEVTVMPNVFNGTSEKYLSASLKLRLSDFHACWLDPSVDLILCARGGYGSAH
ncbi:MAG: LD-carboxypeptidase, partial [Victivallaceae bacterium]